MCSFGCRSMNPSSAPILPACGIFSQMGGRGQNFDALRKDYLENLYYETSWQKKKGTLGYSFPQNVPYATQFFFFYIYAHFVVQNYVHFFLSTQNKSLREGLPVGRKVGRKRNSGIPSLLFSVYLKIHNYLFYKCHNLLMEEEKLFYPHHPPPLFTTVSCK